MTTGEDVAAKVERRWAGVATVLMLILVAMTVFTGVHFAMMPPSRVETADPRTLHLAGEFMDANLGTAVERDGTVMVRAIGQQYSFTPQCIVVPADTKLTFRMTSSDVVHGLLIEDTNINTMLVPGYVSTFRTSFPKPGEHEMPCHEYCGTGHEGMWGKVRVLDKAAFDKLAAERRRLTCVK